MEFRLTYEGPLQPTKNKSRPEHVHELRRRFHFQLRNLWKTEPYLRSAYRSDKTHGRIMPEEKLDTYLAEKFAHFGFNFVPLVTGAVRLHCSVDVLFLRPEPPGGVVQSGDLDGRVNTIFDALSMPQQKEQIAGLTPSDDEKPFYCLVTDDKLIGKISVETDTLHEPVSFPVDKFDARLVLKVTLKPFDMGWDNISFS